MAWEVDRLPPWKLRLRSFAPVPLRLMLGFGLLFHGYPKLFTAEGHGATADTLYAFGFPATGLTSYLVGAFEFFGGILLGLGVAVRFLSLLGIVEMVTTAALVHWPQGFDFVHVVGVGPGGEVQYGLPGWEVNALYTAGFLSLLLSGAGALALPSIRENGALGREHRTEPEEVEREAAAPEESSPLVGQ